MTVGQSKVKVDLSTAFLGIITSILIAGVGWAYHINGRLATIETRMDAVRIFGEDISKLRGRVEDLEKAVLRATLTIGE